jgi:hypothetical protein
MYSKSYVMKKMSFVIVAVMFFSAARSQNLSLGPTVGFGHSWLSLSENDGFKNKFHSSYNIGGKLVYSFVSSWGISADVKYSSEGGTKELDDVGNTKYDYRLNYIRIPLQGIYFFEQLGDRARPKISLGPSFGFLIGGESKQNGGGGVNSIASKDLFSGFDFGLNAAIGCNIRVGKATWLNTDITYYHGFSNIAEDGGDLKVRNRGLGINVGLLFPMGTVKPDK